MKSKMMAMFVAGLALAVGAFSVTPPAEALNVTTKKPSVVSVSRTAHYTYILGLDGNIWYTLSSSVATTPAKTGNAGNAFDFSGLNFGTSGFVSGASLCTSSATTSGATCSQNWVKFPGAANFNDSPNVSLFGPIAATTSASVISAGSTVGALFSFLPASNAMLINVLAPGLDNNVWYTLVDGIGNSGSTAGMNGSNGGAIPSGDPFATAAELSDTGFVSPASLTTACNGATPPRVGCTGIWAPYP